jgi:hypothetical protein
MIDIEQAIKQYLNKQTDYAVQIVGKWGIGKTFFYKTKLKPLILKIATYYNNKKTYKPLYISVFGLRSAEDIATKIVLDLFHAKVFNAYQKKKRLAVSESVIKIVLRGFLNAKRLGNLKDYNADIKDIAENTLDAREMVVCIDDLERRHPSFHLEEVIGYLNSLVDEAF